MSTKISAKHKLRQYAELSAKRNATFEEMAHVLDEAERAPKAEHYRLAIASHRAELYCRSGQPLERCIEFLEAAIALEQPLWFRAETILVACALQPGLAPRYLDSTIAELEAVAESDEVARNVLESARRLHQRLLAQSGH